MSGICELLGCAQPIVLAGMGGPARSELVAAVSEAGGFGFLGMVREPVDLIAREVETLRRRGIFRFGINIIPAATERGLLDAQLETIIGLQVPVVALFWDIDVAIVARLRAAGIVVVHQVGSVEEGGRARQAGAQVIVAQGREAGGHVRGRAPLRELVPAMVTAVDLPVLAAGGMATGGDLLVAMALGAQGIVLGTALLASTESFAHDYHKQRLLAAEAEDTLLTEIFHINWPAGAAVRVLASAVTERGEGPAGLRTVIGHEEGRPIYLFGTDSPLRSMTGDFESMALYAGTGVGAVTRIRPAGDIVRDIVADAEVAPLADAAGIELSSPICYAGEIGGAYAGELEPDEVRAEIAGLRDELKALLVETLARAAGERDGDGPAFAGDVLPIARCMAKLAPIADTAGAASGAALGGGAVRAAILGHLGRIVPRLPDNGLRAELVALRLRLEQEPALAGG